MFAWRVLGRRPLSSWSLARGPLGPGPLGSCGPEPLGRWPFGLETRRSGIQTLLGPEVLCLNARACGLLRPGPSSSSQRSCWNLRVGCLALRGNYLFTLPRRAKQLTLSLHPRSHSAFGFTFDKYLRFCVFCLSEVTIKVAQLNEMVQNLTCLAKQYCFISHS